MWNKSKLQTWATRIAAGEVCAAPAEGVYGYVADPFQQTAIEKIIEIKQRNANKGLIVLVQNVNLISKLTGELPPACQHAIDTYFPCPQSAPVTLILPLNNPAFAAELPHIAALLTGGRNTLAIRVPACPYMQEYMSETNGFLISTSLNIAGEPPVSAAAHIPAEMRNHTLILEEDHTPNQTLNGASSRIYNPITNEWLR